MKTTKKLMLFACIFACIMLLASCSGVKVTPGDDGSITVTPGTGGGATHVHAYQRDALPANYDCTVGATVTMRCSCGETKPETIPATTHQLTTYDAKAPTCLLDGYEEYSVCSNCSYTSFAKIPATGHQYSDYSAKEPTCTEHGWTAYKVCGTCAHSTYVRLPEKGHSFVNGYCYCGEESPDAHEHLWDNGVTQAATCTVSGSITYTCQDVHCGQTKQETIPAHGHSYVKHEEKAPTCTEDGYESYNVCINVNCDGNGIQAPVTLPALGHDDVAYEAKASSCTQFGWKAYSVCNRCDRSTYEEIPALGHTFENGFCACGQEDGNHSCVWDSGYVSVEATCTATGVKTFTCTDENCGDTKTEPIPALGHDNVHYDKKNATCEEDGYHAYDVCERCGYSTFREIAATGHTYNIGVVVTQPTCTASGVRRYSCACGKSFDTEIEKLGHDFGGWYVVVDATCTASGREQRVCLNDSTHVDMRSTAPVGHIWGEYYVSKAATCTSVGEELRYCLRDASHVDAPRVLPMIEHNVDASGACTSCKQLIKPPLPTPQITTSGFSAFWNAVEGAVSYELTLDYNGTRESITTEALTLNLETYFLKCSSMDVSIRALAAASSSSSNSAWGVFEFVIPEGTIIDHGGIGKGVDLLNGAYTDYENGSKLSIFNPNVLNRVNVDDYSSQKSEHHSDAVYSESLESYIDRLTESNSNKMSISGSLGYGDIAKVTAGYAFEVGSSYEKKNYNETQAIFYDIYYTYKGYQTGIKGYLTALMAMGAVDREAALQALTSEQFRRDAERLQNGEITPEQFIDTYGTHIITEAIYGASFNAHYEYLSTKTEAVATFGENMKDAITASIMASLAGVKFDLEASDEKTVSSSTFISNTTNKVHSKFIFHALGGKKPVNMAKMTFAEFSAACGEWASSIENASDYAFIDVPDGSLWFVWDFLGDEYAEAKAILNQYFYTTCEAQSDAINAKINGMYKDFFTFDKDTGTLTFDFSACQAPDQTNNVDLTGTCEYKNGTSTMFDGRQFVIYPKYNGQTVKRVIFKGGYMTKDHLTDQLITNQFSNLYIVFDDDWSEDIVVEFQNFGFIAPDGCTALDFSQTKSENITVIVTGAASIQGGKGSASAGGIGINANAKNLTIEGTRNLEVIGGNGANGASAGADGFDGGIGIYAEKLNVNIIGELNVTGGSGGNGYKGADSNDTGNAGWDRTLTWQGKAGTGGEGGEGGKGGDGGNGGDAMIGTLYVEFGTCSFAGGTGGNGAKGGKGGKGGRGGNNSAWGTDSKGTGDGGKGGTGGTGGDAGHGGYNDQLMYSVSEDATLIVSSGENGTVGAGGAGGDGGNPGTAKTACPGGGKKGAAGATGAPGTVKT